MERRVTGPLDESDEVNHDPASSNGEEDETGFDDMPVEAGWEDEEGDDDEDEGEC